jgi:hypothetical protein
LGFPMIFTKPDLYIDFLYYTKVDIKVKS